MILKGIKRKIIALTALLSLSFNVFCQDAKQTVFDIIENDTQGKLIAYLNTNPDYVFIKNESGETPLFGALRKNYDFKTITYIIKLGASLSAKTKSKQTLLMYACAYSTDTDIINYFINAKSSLFDVSKKSKILKQDEDGNDCFYYASLNPQSHQAIQTLLKYLPDYPVAVQQQQQEENTDTEDTVEQTEETEQAEQLPEESEQITQKEDISKILSNLVTPQAAEKNEALLKTAVEQNDDAAASHNLYDYFPKEEEPFIPSAVPQAKEKHMLIQQPDERSENGRTALMEAANKGNLPLIKDLIYSKADVNLTDNEGWTALMYASRYQSDSKVVQELIDAGADRYTKNNYGITALMLAAGNAKNPNIVRILLKNRIGSEEEVRAAFVTAIKSGTTLEILDVFLESGVSVNTPYKGMTPLMYAAESNSETAIISWLLEHGANINYKTNTSKTAFDFATANRKLKKDNIYWSLNTAYKSGAY